MIIDTSKGPMDDSLLRIVETLTQVPAGECVVVEHFLGDECVKRAVTINVSEKAMASIGLVEN